jgi:hypothetical protein
MLICNVYNGVVFRAFAEGGGEGKRKGEGWEGKVFNNDFFLRKKM